VPKLSVGDVVIVRGDISQSGAERQIKVNKSGSITTIGHADFSSPEHSSADSFSSESVGSLVAISGEVVKNSAKLVTLDDGTGEVVVAFPSNGSVPKPKMKLGQILSVVGVVRAASDGLRVMPRQADEVSVSDAVDPSSTTVGLAPRAAASSTTLSIPSSTGSPLLPIGLAGAGVALSGVIWWVRKSHGV
jgi:RecJ-like exonuclease